MEVYKGYPRHDKGCRCQGCCKDILDGDKLNLVAALTTDERDYVVRNNGDRVKVSSLVGKTIILFHTLLPIPNDDHHVSDVSLELTHAYHSLYPRGDFEVVMVPKFRSESVTDQSVFDECFSVFPWLSLPFHDSETRCRLWMFLDQYDRIPTPIHVVDTQARFFAPPLIDLLTYGLENCFPFTDQRFKELSHHMNHLAYLIHDNSKDSNNIISLDMLLSTPTSTREFVVSLHNECHKVLISTLNKKLVGLYLCNTLEYSKKLKRVYNKCRARGLEIEIILVYVNFDTTQHDYDKLILNEFQGMPWLAIPFSDKRSRRLLCDQAFVYCPDDQFVVIGPNGAFFDTYAGDVMSTYGISAYPFTRAKVMYNEMTRLMALRLESLLVYKGRDYVIRKNGARLPVSCLRGRTIVLYFGWDDSDRSLFRRLLKWYDQLKAIDDAFEVIYVGFDRNKSSFIRSFARMPWLALPYDLDHSNFLADQTLNGSFGDTLLGFGSDGRLLTMEAQDYLEDIGTDAYPFTDCDLFEEVELSISDKHNWHYICPMIDDD